MSYGKLAPQVRAFVLWLLEHYHEDKRTLEELKNDLIPSPVANTSLSGGRGGGDGRSTEHVVERMVTNQNIRHIETSQAAVQRVLRKCTPEEIKLIELVYWRHEKKIEGAALEVGYSPVTAYRHINDILLNIALEMGYISEK